MTGLGRGLGGLGPQGSGRDSSTAGARWWTLLALVCRSRLSCAPRSRPQWRRQAARVVPEPLLLLCAPSQQAAHRLVCWRVTTLAVVRAFELEEASFTRACKHLRLARQQEHGGKRTLVTDGVRWEAEDDPDKLVQKCRLQIQVNIQFLECFVNRNYRSHERDSWNCVQDGENQFPDLETRHQFFKFCCWLCRCVLRGGCAWAAAGWRWLALVGLGSVAVKRLCTGKFQGCFVGLSLCESTVCSANLKRSIRISSGWPTAARSSWRACAALRTISKKTFPRATMSVRQHSRVGVADLLDVCGIRIGRRIALAADIVGRVPEHIPGRT